MISPTLSSYGGGGGGKKSGGILDKILEIPKGIVGGVRRIKGGLVAMKGGWLQVRMTRLEHMDEIVTMQDLVDFILSTTKLQNLEYF